MQVAMTRWQEARGCQELVNRQSIRLFCKATKTENIKKGPGALPSA
jgi:hypothetical protein